MSIIHKGDEMKTTLNKIRSHHPCGIKPRPDGTRTGLCRLMSFLGKTTADDDPVTILQILDSNGLDDALWCMCAVDGHDITKRKIALRYARSVEHLNSDPRVKACNDATQAVIDGTGTIEAMEYAMDVVRAARVVGKAARNNVATFAAMDVVRAARAAARSDAWAAKGAAWAASWAAMTAGAWASAAAMDATRDDAACKAVQERELRRLLAEEEMV